MNAQLPDMNEMAEAFETMSDAQASLAVQIRRFPQHPMNHAQQIMDILGRIEGRLDGIEGRLDGIEGRLETVDLRTQDMDLRMQAMDLRMQANAYNVNCKLANQFIHQANVALHPLHHTTTNEPIANFPATLNDIQTERSQNNIRRLLQALDYIPPANGDLQTLRRALRQAIGCSEA